jgi:hypothetical protein
MFELAQDQAMQNSRLIRLHVKHCPTNPIWLHVVHDRTASMSFKQRGFG